MVKNKIYKHIFLLPAYVTLLVIVFGICFTFFWAIPISFIDQYGIVAGLTLYFFSAWCVAVVFYLLLSFDP